MKQPSRRRTGVYTTSRTTSRIGRSEELPDSIGAGARRSSRALRVANPLVDVFPSGLLLGLDHQENSRQEHFNHDSAAPDLGSWWVAHTLPRQEKAVAASLLGREVAFYVPLVTRKSITRGRTRLAQIPLFPGYVFLFGDDEDRLSALKTNRLLTVQRVPDGEQLRGQLLRLSELIAAGAPLVRESRLIAGERVRVKSGPFRDNEGIVLRRNGKTELLISIDFLQQGAALEIEDCLLEPV